MKPNMRKRWIGMLSLALIVVAAIVVVLTVFAGTNDDRFTATAYSDVIRFEAQGVASLHVRVYDLSGKEVWDSGVMSGDSVDWDRRNKFGERLAYGAYLYSAQGWGASGDSIFQKNGKLALMPGDRVQLQSAPPETTPQGDDNLAPFRDEPFTFQPMAVDQDHSGESWAFGQVGIGTTSPAENLHVVGNIQIDGSNKIIMKPGTASSVDRLDFFAVRDNKGMAFTIFPNGTSYNTKFSMANQSSQSDFGSVYIEASINTAYISPQDAGNPTNSITTLSLGGGVTSTQDWDVIIIRGSDTRIGIGTTNPSANLDIVGSESNLLRLADSASPTNAVFRVEKDGDVYADGAFYGSSFQSGAADVAERINTSEWVEAGDVVEIDPEHVGFFRKATGQYSQRIAGIISTSPGVILGNDIAPVSDSWDDNRPVLAIAGRAPCKVSTENGSIQIGDLLVSSSTPGIAMKGDSERAMGAVVGKAMEPLENGAGTIMVQVMLR